MSRLLLALSALVGLIIAAFVTLLFLLDNPDAYKQRLSDTFEAQTGYGLQINGNLDWQYFPPIAIGMSDVAVTVPGLELPLASLKSAAIDIKVLPLIFGGSIEVSGIAIDGITVNATVDQSGTGNWEVSDGSAADNETTEPTTSPTEGAETPVAADNAATSLQIDIGGISITNTVINYQDLSSNSHYVIDLTRLVTGPLGTGVSTDIEAELKLEDKISGMVVSNTINGQAAINESLDLFTLAELALETRVDEPGSETLATNLLLTGEVNLASETAKLSQAAVTVGGATFNLRLNAEQIFGDTNFSGSMNAAEFNGKTLLQALDVDPGEMTNPNAMNKISLDAAMTGNLDQIQLSKLTLRLDQTTLTGMAGIQLEPKMAVTFDLQVDSINASDYMAASTDSTATTAAGNTSVVDSELIPRELLESTDINGKLAINQLSYETWRLSNLNLTVLNKNRTLAVTGNAQAYEGNMTFKLNSRYPANATTTDSEFTISGIDIAKALEVQAITGSIEMQAKHQFTGHMMSNLTRTLDGQANFNIADGTLDVRPIKQLAVIVDGVQGTQSGIAEWPDLMPFKSLNGNHKINQGIADNQSFAANLENMRITGTGGIDYFGNQMAYDIEAILLENVGGQFTVNPKLTGVRWPITCAGPLDADPVSLCLPDRAAVTQLLTKMATEAAKKQGREALEKKIEEKVPDELKDAAKGLLKGLFGN
jgi:AsmA protein